MAIISTGLGDALQKYTFTDDDGEVLASFRINPSDTRLAARVQAASEFFKAEAKKVSAKSSLADVVQFNDRIEEKLCEILGYDVRESLFGILSATTILPSGELFAMKIVETIAEAIKPELEKRSALAKNLRKHVAKYTK